MITLIKASNDNIKHWLIEDVGLTLVKTLQFADRSGAKVIVLGGATPGVHEFEQGTPVAISLPKGQWKVERSDDGRKYSEVTTLTSWTNGSTRINLILDGKKPFARLWGRYTKL